MARRRSWSPPASSAHLSNPVPSLAQVTGAPALPGTWSANPRDHLAVFRPACTIPSCREPGMVWSRCRCGLVVARCHHHEPTAPARVARDHHESACTAARYR